MARPAALPRALLGYMDPKRHIHVPRNLHEHPSAERLLTKALRTWDEVDPCQVALNPARAPHTDAEGHIKPTRRLQGCWQRARSWGGRKAPGDSAHPADQASGRWH